MQDGFNIVHFVWRGSTYHKLLLDACRPHLPQAGKSTLIGTLTTSSLDDGRGKSRTSIMKHRHEIESGRTSTATTHLMGFRSTGEPITGKDQVRANKRKTEDEIARESYRIITLMDLAGHEKYLKTT